MAYAKMCILGSWMARVGSAIVSLHVLDDISNRMFEGRHSSDYTYLLSCRSDLIHAIEVNDFSDVEYAHALLLLFAIGDILQDWTDYIKWYSHIVEHSLMSNEDNFILKELHILFAYSLLMSGACDQSYMEFQAVFRTGISEFDARRMTTMLNCAASAGLCAKTVLAVLGQIDDGQSMRTR
ncbi:MAG: hypothetical protein ACK5UR_09815 [Armatimonadota bacterium]|nr:hypothetical protein [Fimbriimonadaceae bacterium]MCZ8139391.1 hypothetical protein [Fimbriimonadaceae bacterium]